MDLDLRQYFCEYVKVKDIYGHEYNDYCFWYEPAKDNAETGEDSIGLNCGVALYASEIVSIEIVDANGKQKETK